MGEPPALPGILAEIETLCGREAAIALALEFGGQELHIPSSEWLAERPEHRLMRALAPDLALAIAARFCGASEYIPRARRACAQWMAAHGAGTKEIAARLGLSGASARQYTRGL